MGKSGGKRRSGPRQLEKLRARLHEAEETLRAIRSGEVDAVVVSGPDGDQVYTIQGAERPYRLLIEEMQEGAAMLGEDGTVLYCNRRFAEMLKRPLESVIGSSIASFLSQDSYQWLLEKAANGGRSRAEMALEVEGAAQMPVLVATNRVQIDGVRTLFFVATDLSDQKKIEEDLLQAQKMESLGRLAAGIAHDFNNVLNTIQGYISALAEEGGNSDGFSEGVAAIQGAAKRGSDLIRHLLTFARKADLKWEIVNLAELLEELKGLCKKAFPENISFCLKCPAEARFVNGDPSQLHLVFLNLCLNARDAMPKGGALTIDLAPASPDALRKHFHGDLLYLCVTVRDTGAGMDEATRSKIFEPFFTTKKDSQGTGLGLSLVHGIVESHGGFIEVESQPGQGSSFRVYLPEEMSLPEYKPIPPGAGITERAGPEPTVLFVEDDESQLNLMKKILEKSGYRVFPAANGSEAVDLYRKHRAAIDLVVLDMGLPVMNGWEAYLKMKEENPGIKTIMISGYIEPQAKSEVFKAGVKHFLQKPYLPSDLINIIQDLLRPAN